MNITKSIRLLLCGSGLISAVCTTGCMSSSYTNDRAAYNPSDGTYQQDKSDGSKLSIGEGFYQSHKRNNKIAETNSDGSYAVDNSTAKKHGFGIPGSELVQGAYNRIVDHFGGPDEISGCGPLASPFPPNISFPPPVVNPAGYPPAPRVCRQYRFIPLPGEPGFYLRCHRDVYLGDGWR